MEARRLEGPLPGNVLSFILCPLAPRGRSNRFRVWLHELKGESGSQDPYGFGPICLNEGLMKPRRGFTLAAGEEKLGGQGFFLS